MVSATAYCIGTTCDAAYRGRAGAWAYARGACTEEGQVYIIQQRGAVEELEDIWYVREAVVGTVGDSVIVRVGAIVGALVVS